MFIAETIAISITTLMLLFCLLIPAVKIIRRLKYAKNLSKINDGTKSPSKEHIEYWDEKHNSELTDPAYSYLFNNIHHED